MEGSINIDYARWLNRYQWDCFCTLTFWKEPATEEADYAFREWNAKLEGGTYDVS
jgi:hypothetical protein